MQDQGFKDNFIPWLELKLGISVEFGTVLLWKLEERAWCNGKRIGLRIKAKEIQYQCDFEQNLLMASSFSCAK